MTTLAVWLNSEHIADLEKVRSGDLHLRYLPASISARGLGSIALSIALPARPRHKGQVVTRWVESMLPEGETRTPWPSPAWLWMKPSVSRSRQRPTSR